MTRIRCSGEVVLVASVTVRRQSLVIVVRVAQRALDSRVSARQRERRLVVVETSLRPRRRVVALRAVGRES